jgi:hypothetical protein
MSANRPELDLISYREHEDNNGDLRQYVQVRERIIREQMAGQVTR